MHISSVYLSTYSKERLISGHTEITTDAGKLTIEFSDSECEAIHNVVMGAYRRKQQTLAKELLENNPDVLRLAPPEKEGEVVEFTEVLF